MMSASTRGDSMMGRSPILMSADDYANAMRRASHLREGGATAASNTELAALEGALALYASRPGQPAERSGRPRSGSGESP